MDGTAAVEISTLLQRLATGGKLSAVEYEVLRARVAQNAGDPHAPLATYFCRARIGVERCTGVIVETNAPYGRAVGVCPVCKQRRTVYFGGYQSVTGDTCE